VTRNGKVDLARIRAWTYGRQRLDGSAPTIAHALRDVTAVYSTQPTAPLALLARCRTMARADLGKLDTARAVVRLAGMRGTIFLMPRDTAPFIVGATAVSIEKQGRRLAYAGVDLDGYARLKAKILAIAQEPVTPDELKTALGDDLPPDVKLMSIVRLIALENHVLRLTLDGSLRTSDMRYVATESWLGEPIHPIDPAEGMAFLARSYLDGYGPARVDDFAWWVGVTKRRASDALKTVDAVDLGDGLLLPARDEDAFFATEPLDPDALAILPKWDAYTMGHAPDGRARFVAEQHRPLAYSQGGGGTLPGDGFPLVLRGGVAVARWGHKLAGKTMQVTVMPFGPRLLPKRLLDGAFDPIARLLEASELGVTWESIG
jgi:hypothetical protein